jgi:hypothetical protein
LTFPLSTVKDIQTKENPDRFRDQGLRINTFKAQRKNRGLQLRKYKESTGVFWQPERSSVAVFERSEKKHQRKRDSGDAWQRLRKGVAVSERSEEEATPWSRSARELR